MSRIRHDAARWFVRLRDAAPDDPVRGRFEAWLLAHPAHAHEYAAFAELWDDFDSNAQLGALAGAAEQQRTSRRNLLKRGTLGIFACLGGGLGWLGWRSQQPLQALTLATAIGQLRTEQLADRSTVTLAGASRVEIRQYRNRRDVTLLAGEASFDVAHDPERPFRIDSGLARITVLGTRFAVARLPDRVRISVASGRVSVSRQDPDGRARPPNWLLGAGDVVDIDVQGAHRTLRRVDDGFAWLRGVLVFNDAPLSEVAATLSRYRAKPVVASGDVPRLTAVVHANDIDAFLRALPRGGSVRVADTATHTELRSR
ncbi:FecR family protein [Jeongeupia naejangsanensis]|uniref:FecR domain-containing protein n=1 Tax=Jeongeupia naejangsanensis TaxID=613195 RepID=A0ABS2BQI4_9NEIS|nr:FecR domain-containing protein [Jeongeupia naejangsanensis]MBM3117838.1 FecR domain-containing protein [Jeongeupia naejangsanensis]